MIQFKIEIKENNNYFYYKNFMGIGDWDWEKSNKLIFMYFKICLFINFIILNYRN